jgi:DUF4097 and DUF4098 domain-containing protein YvlB
MNSKLFKIIITVLGLLMSAPVVLAQEGTPAEEDEAPLQQVRAMAADPNVVISLCLESGNITVTGGDRQRPEDPKAASQATRLDVLVSDSPKNGPGRSNDCRGTTDVELEVPRGATLYLKTREGDVEIADVAEVRVETTSGNINLRRVTKATEAGSVSGDVSLEESNGRIRLRSISGNIDAVNAKVNEPNDFLYAKTMSGDVRLEQVAQPRVEAGTITGEVSLKGPLARGGSYQFQTTTGDISLIMPESVSFQVTAKVAQGGEVVTDFPLKYTGETDPVAVLSSGKIMGTYGSGPAATIKLTSFSGTLRLRKM